MTAVLAPGQLWSTMPGWGIVADLTPPELIASRRLRVVRRAIIAALILLLALFVLAYGVAVLQSHSAAKALASENGRTRTLQTETHKYRDVVQIRGTLKQVQTQVSTLMAADTGFSTLIEQLRKTLPPSMTISQVQLTLNAPGAAAANSAATSGVLDPSAHAHIGSITLSGSGNRLDDLAVYVDRLAGVKGFTDIVPTANQSTGTSTKYSVTLAFTDELLSHQYDPVKNGGK